MKVISNDERDAPIELVGGKARGLFTLKSLESKPIPNTKYRPEFCSVFLGKCACLTVGSSNPSIADIYLANSVSSIGKILNLLNPSILPVISRYSEILFCSPSDNS